MPSGEPSGLLLRWPMPARLSPLASRFYIPSMLSGSVELFFDFSRLSDSARAEWLCLVEQAACCIGIRATHHSFPKVISDEAEDFVFITSSRALSRKLLLTFDRIYIQPESGVREVDPWLLHARGSAVNPNLAPAVFKVSLISSIYAGDSFLQGFLANARALQAYDECEHLLIRAGSPGKEQAALIEHVRRFPNAIYVNLKTDPGLYEVWNLGARLATGRYVSNANLDDRRAPAHVHHLSELLDRYQNVDVASGALRVTSEKNLSWEASRLCPLWPKGEASGSYGAGALFRRQGRGLASRNLPHCMPLWRRSLHARIGDFDERRYGPSADWAYWLRAGSAGAGFYFDSTPLGLYLKDENSYWRRHSVAGAVSTHDAAIIDEFGALADSGAAKIPLSRRPLSLELSLVVRRAEAGASLDALGYLLLLWSDFSGRSGENGRTLLLRTGQHYFGRGFEEALLARFGVLAARNVGIALFAALVDLAQAFVADAKRPLLQSRRGRMLSLAAIDWFECYDDPRGVLLLAFLAGGTGEVSIEKALLQREHDANPARFWRIVQDVYRFTRPLNSLCREVARGECRLAPDDGASRLIAYFPDYRGNAYLDLLYRSLGKDGIVRPVGEIEGLVSLLPSPTHENILHLHWINAVTANAGNSSALAQLRADAFLTTIEEKKRLGFRIYWTIHNYLSHECAHPKLDLALRRSLYGLADRVFVHHPLAAYLLDWLPDRDKLCLSEHGAYPVATDPITSRRAMREKLGISAENFVLMHVGRVRAYKGLGDWLPVLRDLLCDNPRLRFVLAGKIASPEIKAWLAANPHPQFLVIDEHVSDEDLEALMAAVDVGILSYDATLTSGTLFHWLSVGRPVLAPNKGTIPCYVVDGWNGYQYPDLETARASIVALADMPAVELERLGGNALKTASQLEWGLWHQL